MYLCYMYFIGIFTFTLYYSYKKRRNVIYTFIGLIMLQATVVIIITIVGLRSFFEFLDKVFYD